MESKIVKVTEAKRMVVARAGGRGKWSDLAKAYKVSVI